MNFFRITYLWHAKSNTEHLLYARRFGFKKLIGVYASWDEGANALRELVK